MFRCRATSSAYGHAVALCAVEGPPPLGASAARRGCARTTGSCPRPLPTDAYAADTLRRTRGGLAVRHVYTLTTGFREFELRKSLSPGVFSARLRRRSTPAVKV